MRDHFRLVLSKAVIQETKINRRHVPKPDPYNMEVGDELLKGDTQNCMTRYKAILCYDFSFSD